jgi:hypothetical protein
MFFSALSLAFFPAAARKEEDLVQPFGHRTQQREAG